MRELKAQLISALLVVITAAAVVCAGINFQQQKKFKLPEDGVTWVDRTQPAGKRVVALYVLPDSQAARADIRSGDALVKINGSPVADSLDVTQVLVRLGSWSRAEYLIERNGVEFKRTVIIGERSPPPALLYQYAVGAAYLFLGLFVYFRRGSAPKAIHFYLLCLASFVYSCFHYTGKLNNFDKVIYWGNVVGGVVAPAIFLHFCLSFPEARRWWQRGFGAGLLYVPALLLTAIYAAFASGMLRISVPLVELHWILDRVWLLLMAGTYLTGAMVLALRARAAQDPVSRQQLKWLRNGAVFGLTPFTVFYVLPYAAGAIPGETAMATVLSLLLVPLTWSYAILRYRLMDVDVIFQQGYVHTLATIAILGIFYGLVFSVGKPDDLSPAAMVSLILIATFIFQPIRNWIQEILDRYYFYRDRYDYRRTLVEFARELAAETDLNHMLASVSDRLLRTLSLDQVAFFLRDESTGAFQLYRMTGRQPAPDTWLDLRFLESHLSKPYLFFERPRHPIDVQADEWPSSVRASIAALDLTYYVPCTVRGRVIAWIATSRSDKGDFLSSDDLELLVTLAGSVGIAIENARLYHSLEQKVDEYERLKEFSENIVESINVGILAADLDDRVESWNAEMERICGVARHQAVGRTLGDLFPADLCEHFDAARQEAGVRHVYKYTLRAGHSNGNGSAVSRELTLNLAVAPLFSRDARQIGRLVIFDDVTERAELEQRLVQADKLSSIGLLAAGVAHEVNTPLAVISTYAQMLAKQVSGDEQKSKLLDKIARQTFRASEIVNSLLNFSRTSSREFSEVDLNRVIRETLQLIEHQLQTARIEVTVELDASLPVIKGNPGRLQQVFLNLFLNARDAMESGGGRLTIRSHGDEASIRLRISDTGHGIPAEQLTRIFDPFFTTKPGRKGTGLGLSVSYGIVQEHGGAIEVQSRPGEGTEFHLEFPLPASVRKTVHAS